MEIHFATQMEDYGPQILAYFRAYGDRAGLEEQLERLGKNVEEPVKDEPGKTHIVFFPNQADFTEADVTGDSVKETLIALKQYDGYGVAQDYEYYELMVFVVGCRNGQFVLSSINTYQAPHYQMIDKVLGNLDIRDLNADGILEILLITGGMQQGSNPWMFYPCFELEIYEWDGNSFLRIPMYFDFIITDLPEIRDIDRNGTLEILVASEWPVHYCEEGPRGRWRFVFMWDGEEFVEMWRDPGEPMYRFQAAFFGDYYVGIALYDRAEASYRRAVSDSSLQQFDFRKWAEKNFSCECGRVTEPGESERIAAYARLRLLELLVFLQKMDAAETQWAYLNDNYRENMPGYAYVRLAKTFWDVISAGDNLAEACSAVRSAAELNSADVFGTMVYGTDNPGPTLDTICPFSSPPDE